MTQAYIETATARQIDYLKSLLRDRDVDDFTVSRIDDAIEAGALTKQTASECIADALRCPKRPLAQARRDAEMITEAGMYRMDGAIYKVQVAVHGSGRLYAKRLCQHTAMDDTYNTRVKQDRTWHFEYAAGVVSKLRAEHRMTLEQAKEFGALYGTCCVCGRTLTDEKSIEAGIGPVCGGRL